MKNLAFKQYQEATRLYSFKVECLQDHCYTMTAEPYIYRIEDEKGEQIEVVIDRNDDDLTTDIKMNKSPTALEGINDIMTLIGIIDRAEQFAWKHDESGTDSETDRYNVVSENSDGIITVELELLL